MWPKLNQTVTLLWKGTPNRKFSILIYINCRSDNGCDGRDLIWFYGNANWTQLPHWLKLIKYFLTFNAGLTPVTFKSIPKNKRFRLKRKTENARLPYKKCLEKNIFSKLKTKSDKYFETTPKYKMAFEKTFLVAFLLLKTPLYCRKKNTSQVITLTQKKRDGASS